MPPLARSVGSNRAQFLLVHAVLIPGAFAFAAVAVHSAGIDERFSALFYDPVTNAFPARSLHTLELIGRRFARSAVAALWLTLLACAIATHYVERIRHMRVLLWNTVAAMALGPSIVVLLKSLNSVHCPWDLKRFGGYADFTSAWFVSPVEAGRCFPGGHAAGGFCLIALLFAGKAAGSQRLITIGLIAGLAAGVSFSLVRIVQGAHFLSHNLWSAAIAWAAAALVFSPALGRHPVRPSQTGNATRR